MAVRGSATEPRPDQAPASTGGPAAPDETRATRRLVSAGAVMAAGTALSRVLGFARLVVLVALFGNATRQADMFAIANTLPNSMYILLAGGVLNTVLVPQLVRAVRRDADGGEAYTNRLMTIGLLGLGLVTVLLTLAVPLVVALYSGPGWKQPGLEAQYASMTALAYWCMPQVFFYGVHVLAGQVLNARDRFGPMMWAPIANNVVSLAVLGLFAVVFGRTDTGTAFTTAEEVVLGLGATVGIAVQAVVLVPFLRSAGYRFRPRLDLRGAGLGHTFRLARWTLGFVAVTQLALVVVNRLATEATVSGRGAGLTAYANAYAVWILPHSLVTVSLATAMLPSASRLGAAGDLRGVAAETMRTVRLAVTVLLPVAVGFVALGLPAAQLAFGFGRGGRDASFVGWTLMALALGLVPFTVQYVLLRAFYALEDTRTTFFLQLVIAGVNVVAAVGLIAATQDGLWVAPVLGLAYSLAYVVGALVSFRRLRRTLPDLEGHSLVAHCVRLLVAALPAAALAWLVCWAVTSRLGSRPALFLALVLAGVVAVGVFVVLARLLRVAEVAQLTTVLRRRRPATSTGTGGTTPEAEVDTEVRSARAAADVETAESSVTSGGSEPPTGLAALSIGGPPTTPAAGPDRGDETAAPGRSEDDGMTQTAIAPTRRDETDEASARGGEFLHVPTAAALPTGTVLAARYRLEELIADSRPSVTWRAFDEVLSRSVLVHVLAPGDPDEPELMAAARRASVATDSRFLRVLDAVGGEESSVGSYIVCEYATGQSLEVLLSQAPLSGLEAAWVVREVADALSGVHGLGLHHRRINPENVIVTPSGNVKIVGLLIDAVLRPNRSTSVPGADTGELVDVADLGRLLYAALVSRWPGGPAYSLAAAPRLGRRWMTPRQVRAGVSPALDNVCDQVLGDPPRHHAAPITTAHQLVAALTKVLGTADASADLERRLHQPIPVVHHGPGRVPPAADPDTGAPPVSALLDQPTEEMTAIRPTLPGAPSSRPAARRPAAEAPVSRPRTVPLSGPRTPAVTQPVAGTPQRSTATATRPTTVRSAATTTTTTTTTTSSQHHRRWVAVLLALCLVLVVAGTVSAQVLSRRLAGAADPQTSSAPAPAPSSSASSPTTSPSGQVLKVVAARDFDPQGDTREENRDEVPLAVDGEDATRWTTVTYKGNPRLGGIKRGVGLVLDLGTAQQVGSVRLRLSGQGTDVDLRVPTEDPAGTSTPPMASDKSWREVASRSDAGSSATLTPDEPVTTRFVLVYLTSLPREGTGYRGGIYEAEVRS